LLEEETLKELEDIHAKALEFIDKHFSEVKKYSRDLRITIISLMGYLIELEKLRIKKGQVAKQQ
jgi:hypothetical protein